MSIKLYVLGGPRCKPLGVSRGSPRLHFIIMFMIMKLFVCCCDRNKSSIQNPVLPQDCWNKVNARKGVLPKLWVLLRQGGGGSASTVYPNLLPFLSRLPAEIIGPGTAFYKEFFTNMKDG